MTQVRFLANALSLVGQSVNMGLEPDQNTNQSRNDIGYSCAVTWMSYRGRGGVTQGLNSGVEGVRVSCMSHQSEQIPWFLVFRLYLQAHYPSLIAWNLLTGG